MAILKKPTSSQDPQADIQDCLRKHDYPGAIRAFEALLKASPGSTQMRMRYADTLVLAGRGSDAIREYLRVAEELAESGFLVRAVAIYKKVVKLDPRRADVVEKLARLDADRSQTSASSSRSAAPSPAAISFDMEEASELDIGIQLGGTPPTGATSPAMPQGFGPAALPQAARPAAAPSPARRAAPPAISLPAPDELSEIDPADLSDIDVADVAALADASDLAPDEPVAVAGGDLTPDDLSFDAAPVVERAPAPRPAAARPAPAPAASGGFGFGLPAPTPEPAGFSFDLPATKEPPAGLGFDLAGLAAPARLAGSAAAAPATTSDPSLAPISIDWSEPPSPPPPRETVTPPAASASGFDFGMPVAAAGESSSAPGSFASAEATLGGPSFASLGGEPAEGDNLLGLIGDDIDSMLDGILRDVGAHDANAAPELPRAQTNIGLFSHLGIDEFVEILKALDRRMVKKGDVIVKEGEPGSSMFIVSEGRVEASIRKGDRQVPVATLGDGEFFGERAVLVGEPRSATVRAIADTELLELSRRELDPILARYPEIEAKLRLAHEERMERNRSLT